MSSKQIQALMTGIVVMVCVICGTILIVNGIDSTVGVILLIIVAGYLGLDLSPWIPWGKNQRKKKDHDCSDEEV